MSKPTVIFLVGGRLDSYKAYTQNFLYFIELARGRGYKVTVSGLRKLGQPLEKEIADKIMVVKKSPLGLLRLIVMNFHELVSHHYDVVVLGSLYTWTFVIHHLALRLRHPNCVVYYMQDPVPESRLLMSTRKSMIRDSLTFYFAVSCEKLACKLSSVILLPSNGCLKIIRTRNELSGKRILFAYNTLGLLRLEQKTKKRLDESTKKRYEIANRSPVILYSGKLQRKIRGIETQLHVLRKLVELHPKSMLVFTGSRMGWFMSEVEKLGLQNNVMFTGVLTDEALNEVYLASDISILPPIEYLLPSKFFEALFMGLVPIIWEKSADMIEVLGKDAVTYDGTEEGLLEVLERVIDELPRYRKEMSQYVTKTLELRKESLQAFSTALSETR